MSNFLVQGDRLNEIHSAMQEKGISVICDRCRRGEYWIYEGSSPTFLIDEDGQLQSQGFPVVIFLCANCGAIQEHSTIVLGL